MERRASAPTTAEGIPYGEILEASTAVLIALIGIDGRIAYVNAASRWLLGYEPEELVGLPGDELIPTGLAEDANAMFLRAREGQTRLKQRILIRRADGTHAHLHCDLTPMTDDDGEITGVVAAAHEIEGDGRSAVPSGADERPRGGEELIERLPAVVYVAEPGERGRWRYVSPQIEAFMGYSPEEWIADSGLWADRVHPDDRARVFEEEDRDVARSAPVATEYRLITRDGRIVWVRDEAVLRLDADGVRYYDGLLIDITERKQFESELQFFADHDSLTGLCNRRRFLAELEVEVRRRRRDDDPATIVMLDVDGLKQVNDSLGHHVGDQLLRAAADAMTKRLRESDTVARIGGDEFAALLRGANQVQAAGIAGELVNLISARAGELAPSHAGMGASAGVAQIRGRFRSPERLLAQADAAMYEAKRKGGGRVQGHRPGSEDA
jgi:diguanylate cyclase (GGDEF)-like protein/PAS domain S-box-containing protein